MLKGSEEMTETYRVLYIRQTQQGKVFKELYIFNRARIFAGLRSGLKRIERCLVEVQRDISGLPALQPALRFQRKEK